MSENKILIDVYQTVFYGALTEAVTYEYIIN